MMKEIKPEKLGSGAMGGNRGSSRFRRLMLYLLTSLVALGLCFVLFAAVLYFFPPAGLITSQVNRLLPSVVGAHSEVQSIKFDTLDHVRIRGLKVEGLLNIPSIRLDLSLIQLLRRRLRIQKIQLDRPIITLRHAAGSWNIPVKTAASAGPEDRRIKRSPVSPQFPVLPVQVNLESFEVKDLALGLYGPGGVEVEAQRINLSASAFTGAARRSLHVEISGRGPDHTVPISLKTTDPRPLEYQAPVSLYARLSSENLDNFAFFLAMKAAGAKIHEKMPRPLPDTALSVSASLNLASQNMTVETFELALGKMMDIALSAKATELFQQPGLTLHIQRLYCEMGEVFSYVRSFMPDVGVSGRVSSPGLSVSLSPSASGKLTDMAEVSGVLKLTDSSISLVKKGLFISGLTMVCKAEKARFQRAMVKEARVDLRARAGAVSLPGTILEGLICSVTAAASPQEKGAVELEMKVSSEALDVPGWGHLAVPASLTVKTKGDFISGRFEIASLAARFGDAARIKASGWIDSWRNPRVIAELEMDAKGGEIFRMIPGSIMKSWRIERLEAAARVKVFLEGMLTNKLALKDGNISAALDADIQDIITGKMRLEDARVRMSLEEARLAGNRFKGGAARVDFSGYRLSAERAVIEDIQATVEAAPATVDSGFRGSIALSAQKAEYVHPSAGAFRSPVRLDAKVNGDPSLGNITVQDVSLVLGDAARLHAHAVLSSWEKRDFEAHWSLGFDAGPMLQLLPDPLRGKIPVRPWQGNNRIDGWCKGRIDRRWMPSGAGEMRVRSEAADLHFTKADVSSDKLRLDAHTKFRFNPEQGLKNIQARHEIRWNFLSLPGGVTLDNGKIQVFTRINDLSMQNMDVTIDAAVSRISGSGFALAPADGVSLNAEFKGDLQTGDLDLSTARLRAAGLGWLDMACSTQGWGRGAAADINCMFEDLSVISALAEGIDDLRLSGSLKARLKAEAAEGFRPLLNRAEMQVPPSLKADVLLQTRGLEIYLGGEKPLVSGGKGAIHARIDPEAWTMHAELSADKMGMFKLPENMNLPVSATADFRLEDRNHLHINELVARMGRTLAVAEVSGMVQGLDPFLTGAASVSAREALRRLSAAIKMKLGLNTEKEIDVAGGLKASGKAEVDVSLSMRGGKDGNIKGTLNMSPVSLRMGEDIFVGPIIADIPVKRTLILNMEARPAGKDLAQTPEKPGPMKAAGFPIRQTPLLEKLRSFSRRQDNLVVDRISVAGLTLTDFRADVAIDEQSIALERFVLNGLGGVAGGSLSMRPAKDLIELKLRANAAGMDLRKLLPPGVLKQGEDAQVNADITLSLPLKIGLSGDAFDIGSVRLALNITHIGEKALENLLLFIDPQEKNPGIASARKALKVASPSQVSVTLRDGLLGIGLQLRSILATERIINLNPLQRVPIESLNNFPIIKQIVQRLDAPFRAAVILGARSLTWSVDGKPVLQ